MLKLQSKSEPVTTKPLPYGRQWIDEDDIQAVTAVLRSDWLTTGPAVDAFENDVAVFTGARHAVAVSSGTAALHAAMHALEIGAGDEVIVPPITFAATANVVVFRGAKPVFADVDPETLCINPASIVERITPRTRAVIAVDYAGQPCDYQTLRSITNRHGLALVADACHALGAEYRSRRVGTLADLTAFSFHPVKHITTGEGGMTVTNDAGLANRMRVFRNHGITTDHRQRSECGSWFYEMVDLGYNYRISDFQCALGSAQLRKLPERLEQRRRIAAQYACRLAGDERITPLGLRDDARHAWHLYVVRLGRDGNPVDRARTFQRMREAGIGVNVHYIPVHLHPYYRQTLGTAPGLCPEAESAYGRILSLPMFPQMSVADVDYVAEALIESLQ
jgi:perosamine synthetase